MSVRKLALPASAVLVFAATSFSQTFEFADFENLAAPSGCIRAATISPSPAPAMPALKLPGMTLTGGQVLKFQNSVQQTFGIPNNVYYTFSSCAGHQPVMTITFDGPAFEVSIGAIAAYGAPGGSLLVQDDRGFSQVFGLGAQSSAGITIQFPETGVRKVTLTLQGSWSPSSPTGFYIDNVDCVLQSPLDFIDPVPGLMSGAGVVTDPEMLATNGTLVKAISADGVARIVLSAQATHVGEMVTFSVLTDSGGQSNSTQEDGGVGAVGDAPGSRKQSVRVAAQDTTRGPMAFAMFYAPPDFARGSQDNPLASRIVQIQMDSSAPNTPAYRQALTILRPPVVLVHDLWEGPTDWDSFTPIINDPRFFIRRAAYNGVLGSRISTPVPALQNGVLGNARESSLGLAYNSPVLLAQIKAFINEYRSAQNAAAGQADVVVHGMGGVIARASVQLATYATPESFTIGNVNKLITIATPHLGTPLANALLRNDNSCFANVLASAGMFSLSSALVDGSTVSGGVGDLVGNGFGGGLSPALNRIQQGGNQTAPVSVIAGVMGSGNTNSLTANPGTAGFIRQACSGSPLASNLTPLGWTLMFGDFNDGFVSLTSQLNGGFAFPLVGVLHSATLDELGFNPLSDLDAQSPVATSVVNLLNTQVRSFQQLP